MKRKLSPLEDIELSKRNEDEKAEITQLRNEKQQLRNEKQQLRNEKHLREEKQLREYVFASKKSSVYPAAVTPSSVNEEDIRLSFVSDSVLARWEFLDLLLCFCDPSDESLHEKKWKGKAGELVTILDRLRGRSADGMVNVTNHELFSLDKGCQKVELAYSSVIAAFLQRNMDSCWGFHQMPARKGTSDVLLCRNGATQGEFLPFCIIECGMSGKSKTDMRTSLRGYAINYCPIIPIEKYFVGIEVLGVDSVQPRMRVKVFYRVADDARVHEAVVWNQDEGMTLQAMLARLLYCLELVQQHNFPDISWKRKWQVLSKNVSVDGDKSMVYKVYDYRDRWENVPDSERRKPEQTLKHIPDCKRVASQDGFCLVAYPFIKGSLEAKVASDFVSVLQQVADLHGKGLVHGDIRAYNMVFREKGGGLLIDFDYCGEDKKSFYPRGYWTELSDTKRHKNAKEKLSLRKEHDLFSLGAVMDLYECSTMHKEWKNLVELLKDHKPDVDKCVNGLKSLGEAQLRWKGEKLTDPLKGNVAENQKTSSPTRKK